MSMQGKVAVVTGSNTGIGLETAVGLAALGATTVLACRNEAKAARAAREVVQRTWSEDVHTVSLDLADLASVRKAAEDVLARWDRLDVLVNNAGGTWSARQETAQGFEYTFGVNHLGHFAFTLGLLDCLTASAGRTGQGARIVTVASEAHFQATGVDFDRVRRRTRGITGMREYAVSKLSNVLFSQELARRLDGTGVTSYALHPGVVASDIWRRVPWPARQLVTRRMLTVEQGARTSLYCATEPGLAAVSGRYYDNCAEREPSPVATAELAGQLWARSEAWTRG